jgi:hypothetical protein
MRKAIINPTLSGFIDDTQGAISQLHAHHASSHYKVLIIFLPASLIETNSDSFNWHSAAIVKTLSIPHYNV